MSMIKKGDRVVVVQGMYKNRTGTAVLDEGAGWCEIRLGTTYKTMPVHLLKVLDKSDKE